MSENTYIHRHGIECPYCKHINYILLPSKSYGEKEIVWCNSDKGGSPFCKVCGKPYTYIGDNVGWPAGSEPYCTCSQRALGDFQFPKKPFKFCPHCGERL